MSKSKADLLCQDAVQILGVHASHVHAGRSVQSGLMVIPCC